MTTLTAKPLRSVYSREHWEALETVLFSGSAALESVRDYARHMRVSPVGLLTVVLVRTLTHVPPAVHLDAGGGPAALNMFAALIGPSGAGKDRTINAATNGLHVYRGDIRQDVPVFPLGSGEGITSPFVPAVDDETPGDDTDNAPAVDRALFEDTEVSSMSTLMNRRGSTLRSTLLKMYSGGSLGSTNKSEKTCVPMGTYRAGLIVGAQPDRAGGILDDDGDGFPQRFLWTELVDPNRRPRTNYPPTGITAVDLDPVFEAGTITFCDAATEATRLSDDRRLITGDTGGMNAHGHLTRLKVAAAFAVLRGSAYVDDDNWERAGALMGYSDRVRASCLAHLEGQKVAEEVQRQARYEAVETQARAARFEAVRNRVFDILESADTDADGWVNERVITRKFGARQREILPDVLDEMLDPTGDERPLEKRPNPNPQASGALQWRIR